MILGFIITVKKFVQSFLAPAHFLEKHRNHTARLGSSASLHCEAKGDHPLKIAWRKAGSSLEPGISDYRYTIKESNTTDGEVSTLGLVSTTREDSGLYFCIASNAYGRDEMTVQLYIQGLFSSYHIVQREIDISFFLIENKKKKKKKIRIQVILIMINCIS